MTNSEKHTQEMGNDSESIQNTIMIPDLTGSRSTVASLATSVKVPVYTPTFDNAACAKTEKTDHEYRM